MLGNRGTRPVPVAFAVVRGKAQTVQKPPPGWLAYHPFASLPLPHPGLAMLGYSIAAGA